MKNIRRKRKREIYCDKNTEMKCPLSTEPIVSCCTEQQHVLQAELEQNNSSPRKRCARVSTKPLPSPVAPIVSFRIDSGIKGKENQELLSPQRTVHDDNVAGDEHFEDSGYLSQQNSQIEHTDLDSEEHLCEGIEKNVCHVGAESSSDFTGGATSILPMLKFQQEVCHTLSENFKKTRCFDWSVISPLAQNCGLHNVIGGKMGLECVDILSALLTKDMRHILSKILRQLGATDLLSCKKVSRCWRKIISQDASALERCRTEEKRLRQEAKPRGSFTRDFTPSRVVLASIQPLTSTPVLPPRRTVLEKGMLQEPAADEQHSHFHKYLEVAKTLKQHESLKQCRQCSSPARYDAPMKRAVCTRASCAYDFCTICLGAFHGSAPCRTGVLRSSSSSSSSSSRSHHSATSHLPLSKQSKRNLRRL